MLAKRVGIALLLKRGYSYLLVMEYLKVSKGTVAKVAEIIHHSDAESQQVLNRIIADKKISEVMGKIDYIIGRLLPPKGASWKTWRGRLEADRHANEKPI